MTTASRARLDELLVERGLADSRRRAQALVAAGLVEVDGVRADSAALPVGPGAGIRLTDSRGHPWAGRGGLKLAAALDQFAVECAGRVCLDAGASTGGFTDVLLHRGASLVYAVDVGHGHLDTRLVADPRVRVLDRTNIRTLAALDGPQPSLVTLDLSFISLRAVLPNIALLAPAAEVVALFKPQFELPRGSVERGGVVREGAATLAALDDLGDWARATLGAAVLDPPVPAGIRGAKGNQEWLVHLRLPAVPG
jgi:23S rRNA (cytidine1920-2'-O)/16S rRNA (cytidine1409-2'-O)-methyltransferase